jgi:hypothetical protein
MINNLKYNTQSPSLSLLQRVRQLVPEWYFKLDTRRAIG